MSRFLSKTGTMKHVFVQYKIVAALYKNCDHVIHSFGLCFTKVLSFGFASPLNSTLSLEQCLAIASIDDLHSSDSYSIPFQLVNTG